MSSTDVEATMERLKKDKRTPAWVREFIAELGASVIILGLHVEKLEGVLREVAPHIASGALRADVLKALAHKEEGE